MKNSKGLAIGVLLLLVVILSVIGVSKIFKSQTSTKTIYGAVGGGKENLLEDEEFLKILKKYKISVTNDSWSNGKLILNDVKRTDGGNYDFIFFSDQRFYDYYKTAPDKSKGEADRYSVKKGGLTLNTPVVIYSWDEVTDALIKENIVTVKDDVYYITDMEKLLNYILEGKTWKDIGVDSLYGKINIDSTDPVTSSPGATYYGLVASIMAGGNLTDENIDEILPKLKEFYKKSGYMNNTPADLFELYLKTGMGAKPMIVDYEKSIIDFANSDPDDYAKVKDKIRILYPVPTIWNSHCIATLTDDGNIYYDVFEDAKVQKLAWTKYGFRTGITGGNYNVKDSVVTGIPQSIDMAVSSLKMIYYNQMIEYLKN